MEENIKHKLIKTLNERLNWEYIAESSAIHHITPLLYWNLSRTDQGKNVPENVMAQFKKVYLETVGWNMIFYHELKEILRAFRNVRVPVICLKGIFLAEAIYKNTGLRSLNDIDLLIKDKDLHKIKKELSNLMYLPLDVYPTRWHEQWWTRLCEDAQVRYANLKRKFMLEVHWHIQPLSSPFKIDINTFWENAQPVTIGGAETMAFAPEDLFQHLCLHVYYHHAKGALRLKWCCDIAEVIRHYGEKIDWEYLVKSSKVYGTEEPMYRGLYLVKTYLGTPVPVHVLSDLNPGISCITFEDMFKKRLKSTKKKRSWRRTNYLNTLAEVDGTWNKMRILLKDIFPCRKFMIHHYSVKNKALVYGYYFLRLGVALQWALFIVWQMLLYPFEVGSRS